MRAPCTGRVHCQGLAVLQGECCTSGRHGMMQKNGIIQCATLHHLQLGPNQLVKDDLNTGLRKHQASPHPGKVLVSTQKSMYL
jgi:hypothetical protein